MLIRPQDAGCHRPAPSSDTLRLMAGRAQDRDHTAPPSRLLLRLERRRRPACRQAQGAELLTRKAARLAWPPRGSRGLRPPDLSSGRPPEMPSDRGARSRPFPESPGLPATGPARHLPQQWAPRCPCSTGQGPRGSGVVGGGQRHTQGRGSPSNSPHVNFLLLPSPHVTYVCPLTALESRLRRVSKG